MLCNGGSGLGIRIVEMKAGLVIMLIFPGSQADGSLKVGHLILTIVNKDKNGANLDTVAMVLQKLRDMSDNHLHP